MDARPAAVIGGPGQVLTDDEVVGFIGDSLSSAGLAGRSVCVIVPDATRSCPLPLLLKAVHQALDGQVSKLTILVALGTHAEMSPDELRVHLGGEYAGVLNHEWWKPDTFAGLGTISADRVGEISGEMLRDEVPVKLNRAVVEHDVALVVGPVFPHEVVGFSGGNKYFFPGVAGQEVIDFSHWLGALITSASIIGTPGITPVRALIDEAAALIPAEKLALSVVAQSGTEALHAVAFGDTVSSWRAAAEISARTHVRYLDHPVQRVVSLMPTKYQDIWTAAKGFYKVEPIVADGGEVILHAPHVTQLAAMHPEIEEIGYHCRDYFLGQWERFRDLHWGVLAHSTHLRGSGTWDPATGEHLRVHVTLATGISPDVVRRANLTPLDPADVDLAAYE
ncbi:DUF2088 domain-containing protein, partial [Kribbella turkmenica]